MHRLKKEDPPLKSAFFHFIFPFSLKNECLDGLVDYLKSIGYKFFDLEDKAQENAYYGGENKVSHKNLKHYFLPFTSDVLFPKTEDPITFRRYSKRVDINAELQSGQVKAPFKFHSIDVFLLPFELGFITIRTELNQVSYSEAIEFAARFRVLENRSREDREAVITHEGQPYKQVENFLFSALLPGFTSYLNVEKVNGAYFESLPFFIDERMYVQGLFQFQSGAEFEETDLFRGSQLDGVDEQGRPHMSASSRDFIYEYCLQNSHTRWAPHTYFLVDEHVFCCLTSEEDGQAAKIIDQMYGEYYYGLLLNLFHKIVLLQLSNEYAHVHLERDNKKTQKLIGEITMFSAKYFFLELATQSQGREIFILLKKTFKNQDLYEDVKQTLSTLYQYQGEKSSKRNNYLISILTIYTVITGIYGMNQVIEELKGPIKWKAFQKFGFFEYIALFVTVSGITVSILLGISFLTKWIREKRNMNGIEERKKNPKSDRHLTVSSKL
ncbi:hypothetical protein [Fictibacillus sp. NRS-1165]|uniref:hypothetical protein n=1 Tax=Fictibacillus sp. NRS-1165 TaxID=3144463 RepID=UPI003D1BC1D6